MRFFFSYRWHVSDKCVQLVPYIQQAASWRQEGTPTGDMPRSRIAVRLTSAVHLPRSPVGSVFDSHHAWPFIYLVVLRTIDRHILTAVRGRSTSGFRRPGRDLLPPSAKRCEVFGKVMHADMPICMVCSPQMGYANARAHDKVISDL